MRADFKVVLDACVLANYGACNLLLKLAEKPRLYRPCWSEELLGETERTQLNDLSWPLALTESSIPLRATRSTPIQPDLML